MLLLLLPCFLFGSTAGFKEESKCYGSQLRMPFEYRPRYFTGKMYFTPKDGGPKKLLMDNGKAIDPRLKISIIGVELTDLTHRDNGILSVLVDGRREEDIIELIIRDCSDEIRRFYGDMCYLNVPRQSEYLEFFRLKSDESKVLWNRTNPQVNKGGKGQMKGGNWQIQHLTPEDSGHYNFRKSDNMLLSRILLTVKAMQSKHSKKEGESLLITSQIQDKSWTLTFTPEGEEWEESLMRDGELDTHTDWYPHQFSRRLVSLNNGFELDPLKTIDSGTYKFRDSQGFLAQTAHVEVEPEVLPTYVYVVAIVAIVAVLIMLCCCVRKCCCKKSSKRDAPAPRVHYHERNKPDGPAYSAAPAQVNIYQPVNHPTPREPAQVYNPVNVHVNPPQPQVAAPGRQESAPVPFMSSDFLSSDSEPKFELKGLSFSPAPPLSSDSAFSNVYNSDKLNFIEH